MTVFHQSASPLLKLFVIVLALLLLLQSYLIYQPRLKDISNISLLRRDVFNRSILNLQYEDAILLNQSVNKTMVAAVKGK